MQITKRFLAAAVSIATLPVTVLAKLFHRLVPESWLARIAPYFPSLKRIGTTNRIAFAMAMWTATVLLSLRMLGVLNDGHDRLLSHRTKLCESVAIGCSQLVSIAKPESQQLLLETLKLRNPELLSVGLRLADGTLPYAVGDHEANWCNVKGQNINCILVPVLRGNEKYGQIEAAFEPPVAKGLLGFFAMPSIRVTMIATLVNLLGFLLWLRRCFQQLDPAQVIPERVRSALDTMAELVLVINEEQNIMLANGKLTELLGGVTEDYQYKKVSTLPWENDFQTLLDACIHETGDANSNISMLDQYGERHVFKLNQSPILDDQGIQQGRLLSLADITLIEKQREELKATLAELRTSQEEIAEQNKQLQYLATRDSMTGCYNRRSFFDVFEKTWNSSQRYGHDVSCVMVDVDHFKSVNDNYGHAMGDEVLKRVASTLLETARDSDIVCRYGGEEFCVLLPQIDIHGATQAAERFRKAIESLEFDQLSISASLGCSDQLQGAETAEGMLEQADMALYQAKRGGRNQVVAYTQVVTSDESTDTLAKEAAPELTAAGEANTDGLSAEQSSAMEASLEERNAAATSADEASQAAGAQVIPDLQSPSIDQPAIVNSP